MSSFNQNHDPKQEFDPNNVESNEGGLLSRLFRTIVKDTNSIGKIGFLVQRYIERETRNNQATPDIMKVKTKSTMLNNAKSTSMSIKVFISLLRDLYCIKRIRLTLELEWPDNRVTVHQVESNLPRPKTSEDPLDESATTKTET